MLLMRKSIFPPTKGPTMHAVDNVLVMIKIAKIEIAQHNTIEQSKHICKSEKFRFVYHIY